MQGIISGLGNVFPVTYAKGVHLSPSMTLDEYIDNRPKVSVKDFGAIGDGIVDDYSAIQGALNSIRNGGELYFPKGTYLIKEAPVVFFSNQKLIFEKGAKLLRGSESLNCLLLSHCDEEVGAYNGVQNVEIIGATFDLGESFNSNGGAIAFIHTNHLTIRDCIFENISGAWHYIECNGSTNVVIENCRFDKVRTSSASAELIQIDASIDLAKYPWMGLKDATVCTEITIRNNYFEGNGFSPAIGNHSEGQHTNIFIYNNLFKNFVASESEQAGHRGVINFVEQAKKIFVFNNQFVNFSKAIIKSGSNVADCMVYNNIFIGNKYAIQAGCTFVNNVIEVLDEVKFVSSGTV